MSKKKSAFLGSLGIMWQIWKALTDEILAFGGNDEAIRLIETDGDLRRRIAVLVVESWNKVEKSFTSLNPQWLRAREIMGNNFFGLEEAMSHFHIIPSKEQMTAFIKIPFSEAELEECKDTHILVAVLPLSILEIRGKVKRGLFCDEPWLKKQAFANDRSEMGWRLVSKTPVENSMSKNWDEQRALISKDDEIPTAQVLVYTIIAYYLISGKRLFEKNNVRTLSFCSGDNIINVGYLNTTSLGFDTADQNYRNGSLGVSFARKPDRQYECSSFVL